MISTRRRVNFVTKSTKTNGYLVEGSSHHGDEHVEEDDDCAPVVDAEHYVTDALRKATLEARTQLYWLGVFQTKQRPKDRTKRKLKPVNNTSYKTYIVISEYIMDA